MNTEQELELTRYRAQLLIRSTYAMYQVYGNKRHRNTCRDLAFILSGRYYYAPRTSNNEGNRAA